MSGTRNYLPGPLSGPGRSSQWESHISAPKSGASPRLGAVSSGSGHSAPRGWVGGQEWQNSRLTQMAGNAVNTARRALVYKQVLNSLKKDDKDKEEPAGPESRLGAPNTGAKSTPFGALGAAPRPHPAQPERLALGPGRQETDRPITHDYNLGRPPLALPRAGQTSNARSSLDITPREHPFTGPQPAPQEFGVGFGTRLSKRDAPDARTAVGPSPFRDTDPQPVVPRQQRTRTKAGGNTRAMKRAINLPID